VIRTEGITHTGVAHTRAARAKGWRNHFHIRDLRRESRSFPEQDSLSLTIEPWCWQPAAWVRGRGGSRSGRITRYEASQCVTQTEEGPGTSGARTFLRESRHCTPIRGFLRARTYVASGVRASQSRASGDADSSMRIKCFRCVCWTGAQFLRAPSVSRVPDNYSEDADLIERPARKIIARTPRYKRLIVCTYVGGAGSMVGYGQTIMFGRPIGIDHPWPDDTVSNSVCGIGEASRWSRRARPPSRDHRFRWTHDAKLTTEKFEKFSGRFGESSGAGPL
jgi:hypothetical protein